MEARKLKRPNVGECQKMYDKYGINDSNHTGTTTDLCAVIQELEQRLEASPLETLVSGAEWIRVEDKLPHEFKTVLFWVPEYENIVTGYLDGRSGNLIKHSDTVIGEVTHWAKLPKPPKEYH